MFMYDFSILAIRAMKLMKFFSSMKRSTMFSLTFYLNSISLHIAASYDAIKFVSLCDSTNEKLFCNMQNLECKMEIRALWCDAISDILCFLLMQQSERNQYLEVCWCELCQIFFDWQLYWELFSLLQTALFEWKCYCSVVQRF